MSVTPTEFCFGSVTLPLAGIKRALYNPNENLLFIEYDNQDQFRLTVPNALYKEFEAVRQHRPSANLKSLEQRINLLETSLGSAVERAEAAFTRQSQRIRDLETKLSKTETGFSNAYTQFQAQLQALNKMVNERTVEIHKLSTKIDDLNKVRGPSPVVHRPSPTKAVQTKNVVYECDLEMDASTVHISKSPATTWRILYGRDVPWSMIEGLILRLDHDDMELYAELNQKMGT